MESLVNKKPTRHEIMLVFHPTEAAIRWVDFLEQEADILNWMAVGSHPHLKYVARSAYHQLHIGQLLHAMSHGEPACEKNRQQQSESRFEKAAQRSSINSETASLNIIGALLTLLLGQSPRGGRYSSFKTLESVILALIANHNGRPGITERALWAKFAEARRHLSSPLENE